MEGRHFACWFRLDKLDQYLIWISGDPDSVLLNDRRIPVFTSETALAQYARSKNVTIVSEEPILHDLDAVEQWLRATDEVVNCLELLSAWNLFMDVSYALNTPFQGNRDYSDTRPTLRDTVYDKLFYGNNVFKLTPGGEYYMPAWTDQERTKIAEVITDGLTIFRRHLTPVRSSLEAYYE